MDTYRSQNSGWAGVHRRDAVAPVAYRPPRIQRFIVRATGHQPVGLVAWSNEAAWRWAEHRYPKGMLLVHGEEWPGFFDRYMTCELFAAHGRPAL